MTAKRLSTMPDSDPRPPPGRAAFSRAFSRETVVADRVPAHGLSAQGIETPAELEAALEAGADYLQGMLLCPPALAGVVFDEDPRPIETLLRRGKLVSFGRKHQQR